MFVGAQRPTVALSLISALLFAPIKIPAGDYGSESSPRITAPKLAIQKESFGLFPAEDFRITSGRCDDCPTPVQALWYFQNELIAVPKNSESAAGLVAHAPGYDEILGGLHTPSFGYQTAPHPSVVWIGSPHIVEHAALSSGGRKLKTRDGAELDLGLTPRISTNRSYYNYSTTEFFRGRSLRIRGMLGRQEDGIRLVARTIWPEDFRVDASTLARGPNRSGESLSQLITRESGGAQSPFQVRLLWQRAGGEERTWAGLPVLGLLLSGGQGDDDESQAGHLAVVTGRLGRNGEMAQWMVNNFYALDEESEKGIIASMLPMDNYLMDLNSGQSYYRPTYLLVAVLKDSRAASRFQAAIEPLYNHFYRHDFQYHHSEANCTGISIDTLRAMGWQIPRKGPTSYPKALAAFFYLAIKDRSFASGKKMFDYLTEEQTRLFPRAAFEASGDDLLAILSGRANASGRRLTDYERTLYDDVVAVLFVRIPQIPSSRAFGTYPVASFDEYRNRVPADRSKWKIVAVNPRPFPDHLKEPLPGKRPGGTPVSVAMWAVVLALLATLAALLRGFHLKYRSNLPKNRPISGAKDVDAKRKL